MLVRQIKIKMGGRSQKGRKRLGERQRKRKSRGDRVGEKKEVRQRKKRGGE